MKKQNFFSSLLISTVALSIALPSLVNADPAGSPPGGNVDATFSSVNAGYGSSTPSIGGDFKGQDAGVQATASGSGYSGIFAGTNGLYSEATTAGGMAGGFYNFASSPAVGVLMGYAGDALLASGPVNLVGRIYSGSTGTPITFGDTEGVSFGDDAGTAQLTISGANGDIADPNGAVTVKDDQGLVLSNSASTAQITMIPSGGFSQINTTGNLQLNLSNGSGSLFFYDGVGSTPLAINRWGIWAPSSPSGPLKIIDSEGLGIADSGGNVKLLIDDTGDISNISGTNPVKFADDQGVQFANTAGTVGLTVSGTGELSNTDAGTAFDSDNIYTLCTALGKAAYIPAGSLTGYCKKAVSLSTVGLDVQGTIINSIAGIPLIFSDSDGVIMSGTGDGIFWIRPNGTTGEVSLANENGDTIVFNGADKVIVGNSASGLQVDSSGQIQKLGAGAVTVNDANGMSVAGHFTAASIGSYVNVNGTPVLLPTTGAEGIPFANCPAGYIVSHCAYSSSDVTGSLYYPTAKMSTSRENIDRYNCAFSLRNNDSFNFYGKARATCFNPNL